MIYSWSQFNYGHQVTAANQTIVFDEGQGKLYAQIPAGSYTLGEFAQSVADAMNAAGTKTYLVVIDRLSTNRLAIAGSQAFTLNLSDAQFTASDLMGFSGLSDLSGQLSYTGDQGSGEVYKPQFMVQSYTPSSNFSESLEATVNQAASGRSELVRFGVLRKIELELKFISNLPMDDVVIKNNPRGLEDVLSFLDYATSKARFEFVPNIKTPSVFQKVILSSTPESQDGTGYRLKELYAENVPDVYETGVLTLQVVK